MSFEVSFEDLDWKLKTTESTYTDFHKFTQQRLNLHTSKNSPGHLVLKSLDREKTER